MNMRISLIALLTLFFTSTNFQANAQGKNVVAYFDALGAFDKEEMLIDYGNLTHIIYSFAIPNSNGTLQSFSDYNQLVMDRMVYEAHKKGVKVLIAVGGATGSGNMPSILANASYRTTLVNALSDMVEDNNLDGIDMDYEFPTSGEAWSFEMLMTALKTELNVLEGSTRLDKELELSMAANAFTWSFTAGVNANTIAACDFINLMAYDNGANINHADASLVASAISHWSGKGCPKSKMCMGLPAYGRTAWSGGTTKIYSEILKMGSGTDAAWWSSVNEGLSFYYNGLPLICTKTQQANTEGLYGVMLWEATFDVLTNDANYQYSIIKKMAECIGKPTCSSPDVPEKVALCSGSASIDATMSSGSWTYQWRKEGKKVSTSANYTASAAGNYTITATKSDGCTRMEHVEVVAENALTTINDTVCVPNSAELKIDHSGGPFNWFTASSGGSSFHTGNTYSATVGTETTYYVEGEGSNETKTYVATSPQFPDGAGWFTDYTGAQINKLRFYAYRPFTIGHADIILKGNQSGKNLVVSVYQSDETTLVDQYSITLDNSYNTEGKYNFHLDLDVPANASATEWYYLDFSAGNAEVWLDNTGGNYPYSVKGIVEFQDVKTSFNEDGNRIMGVYNMGIHWKNGSGGCGRYPVKAVVNCTVDNRRTIEETSFSVFPNPSNDVFTLNLDNNLNSNFRIEVYDVTGKLSESSIHTGSENNINFGKSLTQGIYTVKVISSNSTSSLKVIKK